MNKTSSPLLLLIILWLAACATATPTAVSTEIVMADENMEKTAVLPTNTPIPSATSTRTPTATISPTPLSTITSTIAPTPTATPAIIVGNFNTLSALELMHSNHDVVYSDDLGEQTHGLVTLEEHERSIGIQSGGGTGCDTLSSQLDKPPFPCLSIVLIEPFIKNKINQVLLVTQIADSDCHICSPTVYGSIFQETPVGWTMRLNSQIPVHGGGYGYSPWAELAQMGIEQFVLVFHHSDMSLGEYTGADILFVEDEIGWKEILSVETSHGYVGDVYEEWGFRSEAEFVTGEHAPYFDYLVITSGTKDFITSDTVWDLQPFTEKRRYIFRNNEYILEE